MRMATPPVRLVKQQFSARLTSQPLAIPQKYLHSGSVFIGTKKNEYFQTECQYHTVEKTALSFFGLKADFSKLCTANNSINQSRWWCRSDITSVSHNTTTSPTADKLPMCVSQCQEVFDKQDANSKNHNLNDNM